MDLFQGVVVGVLWGVILGSLLGTLLGHRDDNNATPQRMSELLNRWRIRAEAQRLEAEKMIAELNSKQ